MTRNPKSPAEHSQPTRPGRRATNLPGGAASDSLSHGSGALPSAASRVVPSYNPPSRAQRLKWVAASLAIVVLVYGAYDLLAVPLIEPSADLRPALRASPDDLKYAGQAVDRQRAELTAWFAPGDWELTAPKVFSSPKGLLLLKEYETQADGSVKIEPCTLVFLPQGQFADEAERRRRAIVLQAPSALLRFDPPLELKNAKIGRLVGGKLEGRITVRSDQREPGQHDDLWLATRDIELVGDRLATPHPVEFRLGQNAGRGRNLSITLAPADAATAQRGLAFGGMRSLELADSVWMRVQPGKADLFPSPALAGGQREATPRAGGAAAATSGAKQPPLEVECAGAFRFDMEKYEATFERTVVVTRANLDGPSDQLTCELLSLFFETVGSPAASAAPSGATPSAADNKAGIPKLELARIVATGQPVIIRSPSRAAQARGPRLEYNVKAQSGSLSGPGMLKGVGPGESAPASSGLAASGRGQSGPRPIEASWSGQLLFQPDEENQVLSIEGDADVQVAGTGRIKAGEIHLWLIEQLDPSRTAAVGAPQQRRRLVPARLLAHSRASPDPPPAATNPADRPERPAARRRVEIDSPQLTGEMGELRAWFDYAADASPPGVSQSQGTVGVRPTQVPTDVAMPHERNSDVWLGASSPPDIAGPPTAADHSVAPPPQQYRIDGDLVQLQVVVRGRTAEVTEVDIEGGVRFAETQTAQPGEAPLRVEGEHVHATQPRPQEFIVTVAGQPAHVEARGMTIDAGAINVDRARNHAWVEGPGEMTFPADRDLDGQPLARPQRIKLSWKGGMDFDGQRARFDRDVVARLEEQRLATASLAATFSRPVRFGEGGPQARPEIERIDCDGGVFLERRARDKTTGRLSSIEKLQTQDLTIQQRSGDLRAQGPGWLSSVRIDTGEGIPGMAGLSRGAAAVQRPASSSAPTSAAAATARREGLVFLGVHFQGEITGNQRNRVMVFQRQVRTVYGPVDDWEGRLDPDNFDSRRDRGVLLDSDRLQVSQVPTRSGQPPSYALEATGNTTVDGNYEGANYWANAARLTYEQAKDLLVLEGSGREPAQLFRQTVVGGPRDTTEAGLILFHPSTNQVQFDRARSVQINDLGGLPRPPRRDASGVIDFPTGPPRPKGSP